ncbi:hypothetical protein FKM82_028862 [Ascaphus truei]
MSSNLLSRKARPALPSPSSAWCVPPSSFLHPPSTAGPIPSFDWQRYPSAGSFPTLARLILARATSASWGKPLGELPPSLS